MKNPMQIGNVKTMQYLIPGWFRCQFVTNPYGLVHLGLEASLEQQVFAFMASETESSSFALQDEVGGQVIQQISQYLAGQRQELDVPSLGFLLFGMQKTVLDAVRNVPYGQTITYAQLAARINQPDAGKKVRDILRKNPLPLIFPCHRVVKDIDDIGSYVCSKYIKNRLLQLEHINRNKTANVLAVKQNLA